MVGFFIEIIDLFFFPHESQFFTCISLGRDLKDLGAGLPGHWSDLPSTVSPFVSKCLW